MSRDNCGRRGLSMPSCPYRKLSPKGKMVRCTLVNIGVPISDDPCPACQADWLSDSPPTRQFPTEAVLSLLRRIHGDLPLDSATTWVFAPQYAPQAKPRAPATRRPCHCDHAGRILKPAVACCDRVYACDIHGQATCGLAQPGVMRCQDCNDFTPIGQR